LGLGSDAVHHENGGKRKRRRDREKGREEKRDLEEALVVSIGRGLVGIIKEPLAVLVGTFLAEGDGDVELEDGGLEENEEIFFDLGGMRSMGLSGLLEEVGVVFLDLGKVVHDVLDAGMGVEFGGRVDGGNGFGHVGDLVEARCTRLWIAGHEVVEKGASCSSEAGDDDGSFDFALFCR